MKLCTPRVIPTEQPYTVGFPGACGGACVMGGVHSHTYSTLDLELSMCILDSDVLKTLAFQIRGEKDPGF